MSSRLMRTLLKLYPRQIRKRYGDELLDLQDEISAQGNVSHARLIQDMVAGALLARRARAGGAIGGRGTDAPARPAHASVQATHRRLVAAIAAQRLTVFSHSQGCFVADGTSCSLKACTEYIASTASETPVVGSSTMPTPGTSRVTKTRCTAYRRVKPRHVFVSG